MKSKSLSWNDRGQNVLKDYLKTVKAKSGGLAVLSSTGDILWKAGKWSTQDWTSLGSLASASKATHDGLMGLLKTKSRLIHFGESKNGLWISWKDSHWMICGFKCSVKESGLSKIYKILKSAPRSIGNFSEALEDWRPESVESALKKGL